jgi:hypothetical protein
VLVGVRGRELDREYVEYLEEPAQTGGVSRLLKGMDELQSAAVESSLRGVLILSVILIHLDNTCGLLILKLLLYVVYQVCVKELAKETFSLCILQVQEYFLLIFGRLSPPFVFFD